MIVVFYYSNGIEEDKIRKILSASGITEEEYQLFNIVNYDSKLVLEERREKIRNVITFGYIAKKSLGRIEIDNLLEFPTAEEVGRFSSTKKKEVIEKIKQLLEIDRELHNNYESLERQVVEVDELQVDREKILALIAEKQKDKKYITYLKDRKTVIEISEKKELKESIHMTIEDLFTLLVMKDVLGATIVEIKKGEKEDV